jgi:transcriptional regulator with XRE-family HTH domain
MTDKADPDRDAHRHLGSAFGQHVRSCRLARGLTQEELADASELSADTIRRLERGEFSPSLRTLGKVCRGLYIELSTLFIAFETGERDVSREIIDALASLTPTERDLLLQLVHRFHRVLKAGPSTKVG